MTTTIHDYARRRSSQWRLWTPSGSVWRAIDAGLEVALRTGYLVAPQRPLQARRLASSVWEEWSHLKGLPAVSVLPSGKLAEVRLYLPDGFELPIEALLGAGRLARGACAFRSTTLISTSRVVSVPVRIKDAAAFAQTLTDFALEHFRPQRGREYFATHPRSGYVRLR